MRAGAHLLQSASKTQYKQLQKLADDISATKGTMMTKSHTERAILGSGLNEYRKRLEEIFRIYNNNNGSHPALNLVEELKKLSP